MGNIESCEANLRTRKAEIEAGDPSYQIHARAILEAVMFVRDLGIDQCRARILDVACGLGFISKELALLGAEVAGLDPSGESIKIAQQEHSGIRFYHSSAEQFPRKMKETNESPFDMAVLNMVLHAVDDQMAMGIIAAIRKCLKPNGAILMAVPTQRWLMKKLVDSALDQDLSKDEGIAWVDKMLQEPSVNLPIKRRNGFSWPEPVTIYNRSAEWYANLLKRNNFGVEIGHGDPDEPKSFREPYIIPKDYLSNYELFQKDKLLMVSFKI